MSKRGITGLLTALGLAAQFANGQLEPDCNPLHTDCQPKKALPEENYSIDFTKQNGLPPDWAIANHEAIDFTTDGARFSYAKKGDAPTMRTDFYMLGGRYDVEMKIAPGQGVISSAVLWSDTQDEIDYEFSGNQFGQTPFPPQDGLWAVETNVFAQGKMWEGAATYQKDAYKPAEQFHKYSVEWDEDSVNWYVDDKVVRSVLAKDTPNGFTFPQSPMKLQLGVWGGGDPGNNHWTVQWAGGEVDMKGAPYTMYVKSVNITNKYPACQYKYNDKSGKASSIEKITDGCSYASAPVKIVKKDPAANDYPVSPPPSASGAAEPSTAAQPSTSSPTSYATYEASSPPASRPSVSSSAQSPDAYPASSPSSSSAASSPTEYPTYQASSPPTSHQSTSSSAGNPTSEGSSSSGAYSSSSVSTGYPTSAGFPTYPAESLPTVDYSSASSVAATTETYSASGASSVSNSSLASAKSLSSTASGSSTPTISQSLTESTGASTQSSSVTAPNGYPMSSPTSSGGILSSLSSMIFGTSTGTVSSGTVSPSASSSLQVSSSSSLTSSILATQSETSSSASVGSDVYSISSEGVTSSATDVVSGGISTIYSTTVYTIASCAPTVTDCPVGKVTTESVSVSTTTYPVSETEGSKPAASSTFSDASTKTQSSIPATLSSLSSVSNSSTSSSSTGSGISYFTYPTTYRPPPQTLPSTYSVSSEITTSILSTVYSTNVVTITSCPPSVTDCPVGKVTTETVSAYTTICPVTRTVLDGTTYGGTVATEGIPPSPSLATYSASSPELTLSESTTLSSSTSLYPIGSSVSSAGSSSSIIGSSDVRSTVSSGIPAATSSSIFGSSAIFSNSTSSSSGISSTGSTLAYSASSIQSSSTATKMTTSTVYSTSVYTITSCAPDVTNCPAKLGQVTTELVSLYTTVCPVVESQTAVQASSSVLPAATETPSPAQTISSYATPRNATISSPVMTTSTVYTSSIYTVSSCKPGEADCSSKIGSITTEVVPLYTTVCPVEETSAALPVATTDSTVSASVPGSSVTQDVSSYSVSSPSGSLESSTLDTASSYATSAQSDTASISSYEASPPSYTTSTIYSTSIYTVTSCAPGVTNCPAKGTVTTEIIAVSTTVCPVSGESKATPGTTAPVVSGGSQYTTAALTISDTLSGSVIVVTTTISFIDTPAPVSYHSTQSVGTAVPVASSSPGPYPNVTKPGTTVTLGNYFTTVIEYDTITPGAPASVSSGAIPTSYYTASSATADVSSYQMSGASSTAAMAPTSAPLLVSSASSYPEESSFADDATTVTSALTNTRTVYETRSHKKSDTCACDAPTVYVTITQTVAQTTVTSTVEPPFPNSYAMSTAPLGTGGSSTSVTPTSTPAAIRRWFRRGHGNGGGHGH